MRTDQIINRAVSAAIWKQTRKTQSLFGLAGRFGRIVLKKSKNAHSSKVDFCSRKVFLTHGRGCAEPERPVGR